jgi:hypothetical protein
MILVLEHLKAIVQAWVGFMPDLSRLVADDKPHRYRNLTRSTHRGKKRKQNSDIDWRLGEWPKWWTARFLRSQHPIINSATAHWSRKVEEPASPLPLLLCFRRRQRRSPIPFLTPPKSPISHSHLTLLPPPPSPVYRRGLVMDKSNLPPASTTAALRGLNKASYKISKQSSSSSSSSSIRASSPPPPPPPSRLSPPLPAPPPSSAPIDHPPPQPPVYNIDKSNFRDVVQKLTGSPSHLLPPQPPAAPAVVAPPASRPFMAPPPSRPLMAPPPPPPPLSAIPSRLHRIRPPPLAPPRPPQILPAPAQPGLSPLPALPSVCMSAESPISAYMRRLRGMPSPIHVPTSPLGFGCLHSPRAPTSPGVAMPATSPRVRDQ